MVDKIKKNIPNIITISRLIISSLGAILFLKEAYILAIICYIYGAISDFIDGAAAKKLDAYSDLGRKLDAFSDKIYALALAIPTIVNGNALILLPIYMEAKIGFHNLKTERNGNKVYTKRVGKFKTASLFPTMILGLLSSIYIPFVIAFIPSLAYTLKLQKMTYNEYKKDEDTIKKGKEIIDNSRGIEHDDIPLKEKLILLKEELKFYSRCSDNEEYIPMIRKRRYKNDRY